MRWKDNLEIIPRKFYRHTVSGEVVSLYGAWPGKGFEIVTEGFTVRNKVTGSIGCGRVPFKTEQEAKDWLKA